MSLYKFLLAAFENYDAEDEGRHAAIVSWLTEIRDGVNQMKELLMALRPEVQALHDSVEELKTQIAAAATEIDATQDAVVDLQKRLAEAQAAGGGISAEDLAEIVGATTSIQEGITKIKAAMPAPVPTPVVEAAAAASEQPPA